jgi:hypothetical protein
MQRNRSGKFNWAMPLNREQLPQPTGAIGMVGKAQGFKVNTFLRNVSKSVERCDIVKDERATSHSWITLNQNDTRHPRAIL